MTKAYRFIRFLLITSMVAVLVNIVFETVHTFHGRGGVLTLLLTYFVSGVVLLISSMMLAIVKLSQSPNGLSHTAPNNSHSVSFLPKGLGWLLPRWFTSEFALDFVDDLQDLAREYSGNNWWIVVSIELVKLVVTFGARRIHGCGDLHLEPELNNQLYSLTPTLERPAAERAVADPKLDERDLLNSLEQELNSYIEQVHTDHSDFRNSLINLLAELTYIDQLENLDGRLDELQPDQAEVTREQYLEWSLALSILREYLAQRRQRLQQNNAQGQEAQEEEDADADTDADADADDGDGQGNPAAAISGKRFLRALWDLSSFPELLGAIKETSRFSVIKKIIDWYTYGKDIVKPRFESIRDRALGILKTIVNFPLMLVLAGRSLRDRHPDNPAIKYSVKITATVLIPIIWVLGTAFLFFRLVMRPGKLLELVGLNEVIEID